MPGTTRYSATFDRPYEEEELRSIANGSHRSRSQSCVGLGAARLYTPLYNLRPSNRSSSTDNDPSKSLENIPTSSKTVVKTTHNNPFQFVKVGTCPLYRKAEEQLKKVKEVKKVEVLKEEEEEWQSNLDSWKSRRRKMSEDVFRRQEEIKQFEQMEQSTQANQKKTKTFSEMVESRARQGRALSLCLLSSPLDLQQWEENNKNNSSRPFSEGSEENSLVNSEDDEMNEKGTQKQKMKSSYCASNGNGIPKLKNKPNKLFELGSPLKDGIYVDSGLESISSSHRTIDTPDSCSEFSQDSGSSIDCDSPRASGLIVNGVNLLEAFNHSSVHKSDSSDSFLSMKTNGQDISSGNRKRVSRENSENHENKHDKELPSSNGYTSKSENDIDSNMSHSSMSDDYKHPVDESNKLERSIESENEVFVDDFEELNSKTHASSSSPDNQMEKNTSNETLEAETLSLSNTPLLQSSTSNSSDNVCSSFKKQNGFKAKDIEVSKSSDSESHSQDKSPATKDTKKRPHKKRPTAKLVSVEISNTKSDSSVCKTGPFDNTPDMDEGSLNVVFKSPSCNSKDVPAMSNSSKRSSTISLSDVLPVEKVAEEMEKLILQQLEEEERAKELSNKVQSSDILESPEHNLTAPSRVVEPPKEKPPPPPCPETKILKTTTVKRVNSTKRIKKEIHKRRSNFLGIDSSDENVICDESSIQPPPGLEEILKAEMAFDRESIKQLDTAAAQRIQLEENEMIKREREIIANLETEERQRHLFTNDELCDMLQEKDRIEQLKEERKRNENERILTETQILRLAEEKQLREREEYIRKQEEGIPSLAELSSRRLSDAGNVSHIPKSNACSFSSEANVSLSGTVIGEGKSLSRLVVDPQSNVEEATEKPVAPAVPPKKKEAIRKERERLRQEQEDLQREREEHRQKLRKRDDPLRTHQEPNGTSTKRIFTLSVALTAIPLSLLFLFSQVSRNAWF